MKRISRILVLAVFLVAGLTTVSAQQVRILLIPKVPALPTTVTSYLDDPFRYFTVQYDVTGVGNSGLDVFIDMDFSVNTHPFYVRTRGNTVPLQPLHLSPKPDFLKADELQAQVQGRLEYYAGEYTNPLSIQQLPEGRYTLCVNVYRWGDWNREQNLNVADCQWFDICYSGSAPELVSPMAGAQMALNGAMVVTPSRKLNFLWTPVISNCAGRNTRFNYKLKVVKVVEGQNYQDAIKYNPTVFSTMVNNNFVELDTLVDIKVQLERGALYVAQVQAEPIQTRNTETFIIANDGNSQPMPFFWGYTDELLRILESAGVDPTGNASRLYNYYMEDESEEGIEEEGVDGLTVWDGGLEEASELETIIGQMKVPYLAGFIQDAVTVSGLTQAYPEERQYVPVPKRRYVASDGYYTVPMTDDLEISFMPARHPSLKKASYAIELFEYKDGGLDSITAAEPLLREEVAALPERYNKMDSHEPVSRTLQGWGAQLKQGSLYYLQLSGLLTVGYWNYTIADTLFYVNGMEAEHVHDTVSRAFAEDALMAANGVFFQWGDNPEKPAFTAPQWKAPVDRTGDDLYDPANDKLPASVPEIKKAATFPVSWTPVKDVVKGDQVEYEVQVYELKSGQTPEEAVSSNKMLVSRTLTDVNEITEQDAEFFKVFSPKKTYLMTLRTQVKSAQRSYHFENGNAALPIVFKIVR